jgi:carboxypeptidase C (cathepsin A)
MKIFFVLCTLALAAEEIETLHTIQLEKEILDYQVHIGKEPLFDAEHNEVGQIGYFSYSKEGNTNRPITFVFNGGPGSSSVWLHMGAFGPRRIPAPEEGQPLTAPFQIVDNLETILDLTDLLFIDPIGTGLTNYTEKGKAYFDVTKDYESIGNFIRDYLTTHRRWNSPKYIAGESYGGLRACGLTGYMQEKLGININGVILISPAIDYQTLSFSADNQLPYLLFFPTYAMTAWYHNRSFSNQSMEEVAGQARNFVYDTYARALLCKRCLTEPEKEELYRQISQFTGISLPIVQREKGRLEGINFLLKFFDDGERVLGRMDTRTIGYYYHPDRVDYFEDPSVSSLDGPFAGAFHHYLASELNCPQNYCLVSLDVHYKWNFFSSHQGYPNLMEGLRQSLVFNPTLKVCVACGYFDCATPFAAAEYCIDHLNLPTPLTSHISTHHYPGGHMFYLNPTARIQFKNDLREFYQK